MIALSSPKAWRFSCPVVVLAVVLAFIVACFFPLAAQAQAQAPVPTLLLGEQQGDAVGFSVESMPSQVVEMDSATYFVAYHS